jgi:putative transposase
MVKSLVEHDLQVISSWKDVLVSELNVQKDHIHLVCSIPPKVSISEYMGILKGKLAIKLFKTYPNLKQKPYWG